MKIDILTLFPKMFKGFLDESLISRAQKNKIIKIKFWDLRKFATNKHQTVDDKPYGGGPGMVMRIDVVDRALKRLKRKEKKSKIILLTPQGEKFTQKKALSLSQNSSLILICGHYEGFDERIRKLVDLELSIGDYILTGGEIPAQVITDAVVRLIPGVIGKKESLKEESFTRPETNPLNPIIPYTLLEYPQYTKPENFNGQKVPKILLSGNHQKIIKWRQKQALKKTAKNRPDLLK